MKLSSNMRLRLSSQADIDVSKYPNFLLRVREGTQLKNDDQMIHINEKNCGTEQPQLSEHPGCSDGEKCSDN